MELLGVALSALTPDNPTSGGRTQPENMLAAKPAGAFINDKSGALCGHRSADRLRQEIADFGPSAGAFVDLSSLCFHAFGLGHWERKMTSTCACGAVEITIGKPPEYIYDCNCSLCRKTGAAWGYFAPAEVTSVGETIPFIRKDKLQPIVAIHSCAQCATTTHFVLTDSYKAQHPGIDQIGVNMRLFDPETLVGITVHYPNGKDWSGEGPFGFRRKALKISAKSPW
jgi:hypothetical protein